MNNPVFAKREILFSYSVFWIFLAIINFLILYYYFHLSLQNSLLDSLTGNLIYSVLALSAWYPAKFISLENYSATRVFINHFVAALISSSVWTGIIFGVLYFSIKSDYKYIEFLNNSLIWRFMLGILYYSLIVMVTYLYIYYSNFKEKMIRESYLNSLVKEAELKMLKYQINPHFIFNSLNSISSLTLSDPLKAQEMTIKLSSFLRSTLSVNDKQLVNLEEELHNIKLYLDIEKIRFEDKFEYFEKVDKKFLSTKVPGMLLQPIVENAIKHGVYESLEKVDIIINIYCENNYLVIQCENNYDPEIKSKQGTGVGLKNILDRLKLIYQQENLLSISAKDNIYKVKIFIPLENCN